MRAGEAVIRLVFGIAVVFGAAISPPPAIAQNFDITGLLIGHTWRWQADNGNTSFEITGYLKGRFTRDASKGQPGEATIWMNRKGEAKRLVSGAFEIRFSPNDCFLTVGRCQYRMTVGDRPAERMRRVSTLENGTWSHELFAKAGTRWEMRESGQFETDEHGAVTWRNYQQDEKKRWSKRMP